MMFKFSTSLRTNAGIGSKFHLIVFKLGLAEASVSKVYLYILVSEHSPSQRKGNRRKNEKEKLE